MSVVNLSAILLAGLISGPGTMFGRTPKQAIALGYDQWLLLATEKGGKAGIPGARDFYLAAVNAKADAALKKAAPAKRKAIAALRPKLEGVGMACLNARAVVDATIDFEAVMNRVRVEAGTFTYLAAGRQKMRSEFVSGNQFREIEDAFRGEIEEAASKAGKTEEAAPAIEGAIKAQYSARGAMNGLTESQAQAARHMIASWLAPSAYAMPFTP